jgi:hypothetical protein
MFLFEIFLFINNVSSALQTEGLLILAFIITSIAFRKSFSISLSRYICTTQAQVSITGTIEFFLTLSIKFLHHLGIMTSTSQMAL